MKSPIATLMAGLLALGSGTAGAAEPVTAPPTREEFAALQAEVEQLRALLPTQAHTMVDVENQFASLWFAAREGNWPLATFYLNETRGRVAWTMRIRPVRKLANGSDIVLAPLAQSLEANGFVPLRAALDRKDLPAFETAYRQTLAACHGCHVAVEKPQLKPDIPQRPGTLLIRLEP